MQVCVLPDDVCPYANTVPLNPSNAAYTTSWPTDLYTYYCVELPWNTWSNENLWSAYLSFIWMLWPSTITHDYVDFYF